MTIRNCKKNDYLDLSYSLASTLDPEVARINYKRGDSTQHHNLITTLKLNLLLSRHVFCPCGFVFDNPIFLNTLRLDKDLQSAITSEADNGRSILTIGIDSSIAEYVEPEQLFNNWLFGQKRDRTNNPCLPKMLGKDRNIESFSTSKNVKHVDLDIYFNDLFDNPNQSKLVKELLSNSDQVLYPDARHEIFRDEVNLNFDSFLKEKVKDDEYKAFKKYVKGSTSISRSVIKQSFPTIWSENDYRFNTYRQRTYFGGNTGSVSSTVGSLTTTLPTEYVKKFLKHAELNKDKSAKIVIENLSFRDILKIREDISYNISRNELDLKIKNAELTRVSDYINILSDDFAPSLFNAINKVNPGALVNFRSKDSFFNKYHPEILGGGSIAMDNVCLGVFSLALGFWQKTSSKNLSKGIPTLSKFKRSIALDQKLN